MRKVKKILCTLLAFCMLMGLSAVAMASTFTDAHGNVIELDDTLEAYSSQVLYGADNAARKGETNLGDMWTDALRWFAVEGNIADYYDEDDIAAGNTGISVGDDNVVALWNGGNLRGDIPEGKFGAEELANVLPYPNKVAVVYMTGAQLLEALEAASQGLPYSEKTSSACASFMQVSGLKYTVDAYKAYDKGEAYGTSWSKANSITRVTITEVNGKAFDENAVYAVITNNANYNGMDSSYAFKEAVEETSDKSTITTASVRDVIWMYIKEKLGGVIGEEYALPQGRITVNGYTYSDVASDDWYSEAVYFADTNGLMSGVPGGAFSPDTTVSRSMMVTVLYRMAGSPEVESDGAEWYSDARAWSVENGISDGYNMDGEITREQAAAMLFRYAVMSGMDAVTMEENLIGYSDSDSISEYAVSAMNWAVGKGIITGYDDLLAPQSGATRAQLAAILMRYAELGI